MTLSTKILWFGTACYVAWGFAIRWVEPTAYDPWWMRLTVAATMIVSWRVLVAFDGDFSRFGPLSAFTACVVQAYYCYVFYRNGYDANWHAGTFITIVAASVCLLTSAQLITYSLFVSATSILLALAMPGLLHSSYLPGVASVPLAVNVALRGRSRWYEEHVCAERAQVKARAAEDALRVRDEYIAIISHELKTPITSIKLRTQMLLRKLKNSAEEPVAFARVKNFAQETDTQASRLVSLVDDMLDLSRITNGRLPLRHEPMSLSDVVDAALRSLDDAFVNAGCALHARVQAEVMVRGDRRRLEQVVLDLLTNAIKYGRGTPVQVDLQCDGLHAALRVRDNGMGVAHGDQARIFERFERAISTRHVSGLGLGLFICNEIVSAHEGSITLESDIGKGACFTVTLPTHLAAGAQLKTADYSSPPPVDHR